MDLTIRHSTGWLDRYAEPLMITVSVAMGVALVGLSLLRHDALLTVLPDLLPAQGMRQVLHGAWTMPVHGPEGIQTLLATQMHLALYPLAPFFFVFGMPLLLALPGIGTATAGWLLFRLTRRLTGSGVLSLLMGLCLLLSPALTGASIGAFHPLALGIPLLIGGLWAAEARWWTVYWLCIAMLLSLQEGMIFVVLALSPLISLRSGLHGTLTMLVAILYGSLLFWLAHLLDIRLGATALTGYTYLGDSVPDVAAMIFGEPTVSWPLLVEVAHDNVSMFSVFLQQGAWLALLAPAAVLPGLLLAATHLFSTTPAAASIGGGAVLVGSIVLACAFSVARIRHELPRAAIVAAAVLLVQSVWLCTRERPLLHAWPGDPVAYDHAALKRIRSMVPAGATLATQDNLAAQFAARAELYPLARAEEAEFVLLHAAVPRGDAHRLLGMQQTTFAEQARSVLRHPRYGVITQEDSFILLWRSASRTGNDAALAILEEDLTALLAESPGA